MHADMTAVTIQSNKIVSNNIKDNEVLLESSQGKNQMNFLANPTFIFRDGKGGRKRGRETLM